jgi:hypothetical protein
MRIPIMTASEDEMSSLTLHQLAGWADERQAWLGTRCVCKAGKTAREWYEVTLGLSVEKGGALRLLWSKLPGLQDALA